jgi:UPF0755 protein
MKKILITGILSLLIVTFFYLFYKQGIMPVDKNSKETKIFVIQKGESLKSIIDNLYRQNLIRNRLAFYLLIKKLGFEKKIQAGDFRLSPSMDAETIAKTLTKGTLDIWVTIIEGLRKEEIAQIINQNFSIPESEFLKYAKEGYLFPDTYLIPKEATAEAIVKILVNNFYRRFNDDLRQKAKDKSLTEEEVVTIASLVEKEAKYEEDRTKVASIILKRLKNDWPLQVDATIQYALGYQPQEKTWWKKNLTKEDLNIDSPYNTYKNKGLPPTPICNPGLASIKAVIFADTNTPYWYYLSDKTGRMHYAKTLEEHNENIKKYLQ